MDDQVECGVEGGEAKQPQDGREAPARDGSAATSRVQTRAQGCAGSNWRPLATPTRGGQPSEITWRVTRDGVAKTTCYSPTAPSQESVTRKNTSFCTHVTSSVGADSNVMASALVVVTPVSTSRPVSNTR